MNLTFLRLLLLAVALIFNTLQPVMAVVSPSAGPGGDCHQAVSPGFENPGEYDHRHHHDQSNHDETAKHDCCQDLGDKEPCNDVTCPANGYVTSSFIEPSGFQISILHSLPMEIQAFPTIFKSQPHKAKYRPPKA